MNSRSRWAALGGIVGPAAFVAAWSILGTTRAGYSHVANPISELAAAGAATRATMSAGFLAFGVGVGAYAFPLRRWLPGGAAAAAAVTAIATVGVAALPLDGIGEGPPHALAAGVAYASLAATPLLGARAFRARGSLAAARASTATGVAIAVALALSAVTPTAAGLAQRIGLTLGDIWIAATAVSILRDTRAA